MFVSHFSVDPTIGNHVVSDGDDRALCHLCEHPFWSIVAKNVPCGVTDVISITMAGSFISMLIGVPHLRLARNAACRSNSRSALSACPVVRSIVIPAVVPVAVRVNVSAGKSITVGSNRAAAAAAAGDASPAATH